MLFFSDKSRLDVSMLKRKFLQTKYILRGGAFILLLYHFCSEKCKKMICEDIHAYSNKSSQELLLLELAFDVAKKAFRNILYYRFQTDGCNERLLRLCRFFVPPLPTVEIGGEIGGGLKIIHGYCIISVKKAGKNLTVMQGATIGKNIDGGQPVIGDNVKIFPNTVVFGDINIGDNVMIGAGSLINKDVPQNAVVVGNPFRIINDRELKANV